MSTDVKRVIIVGGGFAGINAAKKLGNRKGVEVTLIDRRNHHLFQPLLYQVAMAGLSPAEIAVPIRSLLSQYKNIRVLLGEVNEIDREANTVSGDFGELSFDYLMLACGATHAYFGNDQWEYHAPGLKTIEQATEIRRRVLHTFECAEREPDAEKRRAQMTFVIVGGGPTGVELAGAIGEMSRFTLDEDFKTIDPKLTRIILVEAAERILPAFSDKLASRAVKDLENLGVQVWTNSMVTGIDDRGVSVGDDRINAGTVLWAAGVKASRLNKQLGGELDRQGRITVTEDLSLTDAPNIFVVGDQAHTQGADGEALPGVAPVAMQQGRYVGQLILDEMKGKERKPFAYYDKGQMATVGRSRAIVEKGSFRLTGWLAWMAWLFVHIYYLSGFKNRLMVFFNWAWSYMTFKRGARLIVGKDWQTFRNRDEKQTLEQVAESR